MSRTARIHIAMSCSALFVWMLPSFAQAKTFPKIGCGANHINLPYRIVLGGEYSLEFTALAQWPTSLKGTQFSCEAFNTMFKEGDAPVLNSDFITSRISTVSADIGILQPDKVFRIEKARNLHLEACIRYAQNRMKNCVQICEESANAYDTALKQCSVEDTPGITRFLQTERAKVVFLAKQATLYLAANKSKFPPPIEPKIESSSID